MVTRWHRGSSVLEYALVVAAIAIGLVAMQRYLIGIFGGVARQAGDVFGSGQQEVKDFLPDE